MGVILPAASAVADDVAYTPSIMGPLGLNAVPNARSFKAGTLQGGVSAADPYIHGYMGFQISDALYAGIRQTGEASGPLKKPERFYPGIDLKLRLFEETRLRPEVVLGFQSAAGHKRMAGEYLAASKRFGAFDFTAGLGWGRFGSAGGLPNPFGKMLSHFDQDRSGDGENPSGPANWFTGNEIGVFGGLEYFTPLKNLSLKFDWGADSHTAERAAGDFKAPARWSAGLSWKPAEWVNAGLAVQGMDKVMARLTFSGNASAWKTRPEHVNARGTNDFQLLRHERAGNTKPAVIAREAMRGGVSVFNVSANESAVSMNAEIPPGETSPFIIGRGAVAMANNTAPDVEVLSVTPTVMGLRGPAVKLLRRDLERALAERQGSAEEIWRGTVFDAGEDNSFSFRKLNRYTQWTDGFRAPVMSIETQIGLLDDDAGMLHRTSFTGGTRGPRFMGIVDTGWALRANLYDNLEQIREFRPYAFLPIRSDVDLFAARPISLDQAWLSYTHSLKPDLHIAATMGYLEEMYYGAGGEILYRPFRSRFALGAEGWQAFRRDPLTPFSLGLNGYAVTSGHLNLWYDLPVDKATLKVSAGRYLGGDIGGGLSVLSHFDNGIKFEAFTVLTNRADYDPLGGESNAYGGLKLSMPLGGQAQWLKNTSVNFTAAPFGRDAGQQVRNPLPLYDLSRSFTYDHMAGNWGDITK